MPERRGTLRVAVVKGTVGERDVAVTGGGIKEEDQPARMPGGEWGWRENGGQVSAMVLPRSR